MNPIVIATWTFGQRCNAAAWPVLASGGSSLDAVEQGCTAVERDPEVDSVGYGGLPDAEGEVTLDASIMLSPSRCGSVCAVRRCLHVTTLARRVMERSRHMMLAGGGADAFARQMGLEETALLSPQAAQTWRASRGGCTSGTSATPGARRDAGGDGEDRWKHHHDTIGTLALDRAGVLAGACSTSGTAYKQPGRIGDSPIIGAGLYVDPRHGAAVATGTGELILGVCGSFLIVELMRRGAGPLDAIQEALHRIDEAFEHGPDDQAAFLALRPDGVFAGGALRSGFKTAIRDEQRDAIVEPEIVLCDD